jgi:hypothetical protein
MAGRTALKVAIGLLHVPSQAQLIRSEPLPDDVMVLLRIVTGGADVAREAALKARRSPDTVRRAAVFFIEQILFAPDADSYRVLGVNSGADAGELQRNAALLFKWLHPEHDAQGTRAAFASRLAAAWSDLKTPDRRVAYDARRRAAAVPPRRGADFASRSRRKQLASLLAQRRTRQREGWLAWLAGSRRFFRRALAMLLHRPSVTTE